MTFRNLVIFVFYVQKGYNLFIEFLFDVRMFSDGMLVYLSLLIHFCDRFMLIPCVCVCECVYMRNVLGSYLQMLEYKFVP